MKKPISGSSVSLLWAKTLLSIWTVIAALESGVPLTLIGEAVFARNLSSMKDERLVAAAQFPKEKITFEGDAAAFTEDIRKALYAAKIISYAQGYALMRAAASSSTRIGPAKVEVQPQILTLYKVFTGLSLGKPVNCRRLLWSRTSIIRKSNLFFWIWMARC